MGRCAPYAVNHCDDMADRTNLNKGSGIMSKMSVIIPLYRGRDTLASTLHSVAMQSIINETEIVVVNDADNANYADILAKFDDLNIVYVQREKNGGCSAARNTGIKNAKNSFITFLDSDDNFISPLSLEIMYNRIVAEKADILVSTFESEMRFANGVAIKQMKSAMTWLHGKVFRRQYLLDNNLFFKENLRLNEDMEFNQIAFDLGGKVAEIPMVTYLWRDNPKSITHESLYENKKWFVLAAIESLKDGIERGIACEKIRLRVLQNLCMIYQYYDIVINDTPEMAEDYIAVCKDYWRLCEPLVRDVSDEEARKIFCAAMRDYEDIPSVTFVEFLNKLRAD
jgi:glycosyltransferase involved in cell wall biosynthesis